MLRYAFLVLACAFVFFRGSASAAQWDDALAFSDSLGTNPFNPTGATATDQAILSGSIHCPTGTSIPSFNLALVTSLPSGCFDTNPIAINLNEFARQGDLVSLAGQAMANANGLLSLQGDLNAFKTSTTAQLNAINAQIVQMNLAVAKANKNAWIGSALASSLVNISPADGQTNRFGVNFATAQGQSAVGFNYTHVAGPLDFNAGLSLSTSQTKYSEIRLGGGISW